MRYFNSHITKRLKFGTLYLYHQQYDKATQYLLRDRDGIFWYNLIHNGIRGIFESQFNHQVRTYKEERMEPVFKENTMLNFSAHNVQLCETME